MVAKEIAEALRRILVKTDILVHMKCVYTPPWYFPVVCQIRAELLENGISYFATFFLGLLLGVLCEASTILNPVVIKLLILGIIALAISAVGGLAGGWIMYLIHKKKGEDYNPVIGIAGVSCVPTTAKLAQHAAQDENPFAMILPVAMGANISGVITSAIIAGIFVATIGMVVV